ncbi:zinc-binding dehydrogenase [Hydrogenophaga sp.]|uniref:zinc-binding dehydrogenase n=1 Tax=Hydrogenophaga sp. TaxID=1904254 RepID=UPI003523E182
MPGPLPSGALDRLAPGGRLGLLTPSLLQVMGASLLPWRTQGRRICARIIKETRHAMTRLIDIHVAGGYRPLLGEVFNLKEIDRAHAAAGSGQKRGNLVIEM